MSRLRAILVANLAVAIGMAGQGFAGAAGDRPLAAAAAGPSRAVSGTAFFVDGSGRMLTARHAVESCARIVVAKERWRVGARLLALSDRFDLALIAVPRTLGLSAVFPRSATPRVDDMVFAGSYEALPGMKIGGGVLANARVTGTAGENAPGHLAMESSAGFGTSGAPVLDRHGLVQGVVSRRGSSGRVLAVGAAEAKSFLSANGVRIEQDDRPQIAASGSRAHRAASLSALVTCLQN
ncbi:MAG: trypsin-like peptidase domain-containing protein [Rhodoplanes sp.]|nr:trypsin-like peptidase domain-containing protein [Rhodoplanes sp.]